MATEQAISISSEAIAARKRYLEITTADEELLRGAHPLIQSRAPEIIERFYEYLLAHEHTRAMLSAPGLVERLKPIQVRYFLEITSGDYGPAYFENRIRVGRVHHRIGLSPEWYIGAYLKYLHIVSDVLSTAFGRDQERYFQTNLSLTKIIHLDMGLTLDAYHLSGREALVDKATELEAVNAKLLELQAAKRLLADMLVHDLQNPLAGIQSFLQVLGQRRESLPEHIRDAIEEALRACGSLSDMILNVLHISRAETGRIEPSFERLDLVQVVREAAEPFLRLFPAEGRELEVVTPTSLLTESDARLVQRICQNLLRNALRHTPRGTRAVLRLELTPRGQPRLTVLDNGPGIPPELHPMLFEPSGAAQLRKAGLRVDSGLGLAFCHVASGALGGTIGVESDGRSGTAFHVLLPAVGAQRGPASGGTDSSAP